VNLIAEIGYFLLNAGGPEVVVIAGHVHLALEFAEVPNQSAYKMTHSEKCGRSGDQRKGDNQVFEYRVWRHFACTIGQPKEAAAFLG
jgi:hypothetical protein